MSFATPFGMLLTLHFGRLKFVVANYWPMFLAYVRYPDGNKLCAIHRSR